ncbi:DNA repair protein RecO [Virgibacillus indicus]|uniref:DNA repair protein RecO n=1 Tax=Virgibacillus indicus TaxID=2024554 RepID=A0A265ND13_9BACI|nr:DNA repair protein RecO [Virgibacillus indicus]OZU89940.1 DNA repair protein RecO [Virgibacillus indicus]
MLEKIDGIIIKTKDYGETHKLITIFSNKLGKFTALARGAKKTKSRMAAVTQPFIYGEFFVYVNSGLSTIQQGEVNNSFRKIREDIIKTAYTAYITELTDKLFDEKAPDPFLYDELYRTMCWISDNEDADIPIMMYELKLFTKGGFAPTVDKCVNCGSRGTPFAFSIKEGGLLCSQCRSMDYDAIALPIAVAKLFNLFATISLDRVGSVSVKPENKKLMRRILDEYYDKYGGFYLKSRKFLNQLDLLRE